MGKNQLLTTERTFVIMKKLKRSSKFIQIILSHFSKRTLVVGQMLVRSARIYTYLHFYNILLYKIIYLIRNMVLWDETIEHNQRKTKSIEKANSDLTKFEAML